MAVDQKSPQPNKENVPKKDQPNPDPKVRLPKSVRQGR